MADTVTNTTLKQDDKELVLHLTCISDGTGESNVVKVDRSSFAALYKDTKRLTIRSVRWAIQGFTYIKISWDHTADDTALVLNGNGYDEFPEGVRDPNTSADTVTGAIGDVLLTSVGAASGATYDITIAFTKEI